jgi:hypothetical protein
MTESMRVSNRRVVGAVGPSEGDLRKGGDYKPFKALTTSEGATRSLKPKEGPVAPTPQWIRNRPARSETWTP